MIGMLWLNDRSCFCPLYRIISADPTTSIPLKYVLTGTSTTKSRSYAHPKFSNPITDLVPSCETNVTLTRTFFNSLRLTGVGIRVGSDGVWERRGFRIIFAFEPERKDSLL